MRILMLAQFYPPSIGGEERHVRDLGIELASRGHDVSLATLWHKGFAPFENDHGVRVHRVRGTMQRLSALFSYADRQYAPPFPDPEVLRELQHVISQERPDIVHAHNWIVHSFVPLKAASKAKLVMTLHDYSLVCTQKRLRRHGMNCTGPGLAKCLNCATHFYGIAKGPLSHLAHGFYAEKEKRAVDMFLPVSQAVAEETRLASQRLPYRIIPNFIPDHAEVADDDAYPYLAQLPEREFMLFVGDLMPDKGVDVLLQAYAALNTDMPLVLIGRREPGHYQHLPSNVLRLGGWPHDAVMAAWQRCAFALAPSIWLDPCPTVAMEAMAMGKPVIAARSGGLRDIVVDGETGYLVPPGDSSALREAIQRLLDNPALCERMGHQAKHSVVKFQASTVVSRIEEVYREVSGEASVEARTPQHAASYK